MSSKESAFEGTDDNQASPHDPEEESSQIDPEEAWHNSDSEDPRAGTRSFRSRLRKKLRERGHPYPDSPPPPGRWAMPPVAGELLAAGGTFIHRRVHRRVIKHACGTKVTKFWRYRILPGEPGAMRFVAEHTTIPVPRVYDVGEDYFTMDFIEGESLYRACDTTLSPEDKALVCRQMRGYISELRAIKSPDGTICSFGGRPAIDDRRIVRREGGPFADEAAYNEFLLDTVRGLDIIRDMIRKKMRTDHEIVLTNGGLDPRNILVRPGVGVVGIIDWSYAGYYPEYFDLLHSFRPFDDGSSAYNNVFQMFPQRYDDEWFVDQVLTLYSRH